MDEKKKVYSKAEFNNYAEAVRRECEQTLMRQRERIEELRKSLSAAEKRIAEYESQKEIVYKAITAALKKADDIERVSLIKYNQEIAQLKSFHDKWIGYYNKIIEAYPLDDNLVAASKTSGKIAEVLDKAGVRNRTATLDVVFAVRERGRVCTGNSRRHAAKYGRRIYRPFARGLLLCRSASPQRGLKGHYARTRRSYGRLIRTAETN